MKKEREEVNKIINRSLHGLLFDKEKQDEFIKTADEKFNMPSGVAMDYIAGRMNVEDADILHLYILAYSAGGTDLIDKIFTESEIRGLEGERLDNNEVMFPIRIPAIQVANDQWIGSCDVVFLMKLRDSQLINYNTNAQRTMQRIIHSGNEYFKIAINKTAIRKIESSFKSGIFIPNTITLNIPETEDDFKYDSSTRELIIYSLKAFDIADGYHRYLAMSQLYEKDNSFNYNMELRIIHFPDSKTKQFIFQEDQKTRMKKLDSESMNTMLPANRIVDRLNADPGFDFAHQISRNGGKINYGEFSAVISYFYKKNPNEEDAPFIINTANKIKSDFNDLYERNTSLMDGKIDFTELMMIFYCITNSENQEIAFSKFSKCMENRYKLSKTAFQNKKPRLKLVREIENIC